MWRHLSGKSFCRLFLAIPFGLFIKNPSQTDAFEAFVKSLSKVPLTSSLSTATWQRSLHQDFWRHSESDGTPLSSKSITQCVQENLLKRFSEKISQEWNCTSPKSKYYFQKKTSLTEFVSFSVTLKVSSALSVLNNFAGLLLMYKQSSTTRCRRIEKKKIIALSIQFHYKRSLLWKNIQVEFPVISLL